MKNIHKLRYFFRIGLMILLFISFYEQSVAQNISADIPVAPKVLPGKGLNQHDFFYAGEAKSRNMYIVRKGKIVWSYIDTVGRGEISDAVLMANGNILFAYQYGVTLINSDRKILWKYEVPNGFETHTAQPIGNNHVVFVQNGNPAKVFVVNIKTDKVIKEFVIPFKSGTHGQIRHARLTAAGTLLIAHMDLGKVNEYDIEGKIVSSIDVPSVWSAAPLKNGNLLVASNQNFVSEITPMGAVVWDFKLASIPGYNLSNPQLAVRLSNGNTLINNWFNEWKGKVDITNPPVQAIEVTPGKKVVWALRSWNAPVNLGPSTTIQLFKETDMVNGVHFGYIK